MQQPSYSRGTLSRACDPWPRGQVLTTDPQRAGNDPGGDAPVYVDGRRFAQLEGAGYLVDVEVAAPGDPAREVRPDAFDDPPAALPGTPGVTVLAHVDPAPVPPDDPRLRQKEDAP